jgi:hypothetical protein
MAVLRHPYVQSGFPYVRYDAIHDDRVRHNHLALEKHGIQQTNIYRADDIVFQTFRPPWDFQDRCGWAPMTIRQAAELGIKEATEWMASGIEPSPPAYVAWPDFRPPPEFQRSLTAQPLTVQLSMLSLDACFAAKNTTRVSGKKPKETKPDLALWELCRDLPLGFPDRAYLPYTCGTIRLPDSDLTVTVKVVDGNRVKIEHDGDYVEGSNWAEEPKWIPEFEVWLDAAICEPERHANLYHEAGEARYMVRDKMAYEEAHETVLAEEMYIRAHLLCELDDQTHEE